MYMYMLSIYLSHIFPAFKKIDLNFLSNLMEHDRDDSFPYDFEPNEIQFGSKSKEKQSLRSYPIRFERKLEYSFLSVKG